MSQSYMLDCIIFIFIIFRLQNVWNISNIYFVKLFVLRSIFPEAWVEGTRRKRQISNSTIPNSIEASEGTVGAVIVDHTWQNVVSRDMPLNPDVSMTSRHPPLRSTPSLSKTIVPSNGSSLGRLARRKNGWRMNCDVGEATEGLENEFWRR